MVRGAEKNQNKNARGPQRPHSTRFSELWVTLCCYAFCATLSHGIAFFSFVVAWVLLSFRATFTQKTEQHSTTSIPIVNYLTEMDGVLCCCFRVGFYRVSCEGVFRQDSEFKAIRFAFAASCFCPAPPLPLPGPRVCGHEAWGQGGFQGLFAMCFLRFLIAGSPCQGFLNFSRGFWRWGGSQAWKRVSSIWFLWFHGVLHLMGVSLPFWFRL